MPKIRELTLQEIADFYGCSVRTAQDRVSEIKGYLKLEHKKRVTNYHLAYYEGMSMDDLNECFSV